MIELIKYEKKYKSIIYSETNIVFPDNKVNFIMGKNGSGKTTLFKCIAGLEGYSGKIKYDGLTLDKVRNEIYVVWDDTPFYDKLNGFDNIILFSEGKIKRTEIMKYAADYLDENTLKRKVKSYSYGQKKKLSIILLEILKPKYIFMDEISNGLDVDTMKLLENKIKKFQKNSTIILTGHQFSFYQHVADNVFVKKDTELKQIDYDKLKNNSLENIYNEEIN